MPQLLVFHTMAPQSSGQGYTTPVQGGDITRSRCPSSQVGPLPASRRSRNTLCKPVYVPCRPPPNIHPHLKGSIYLGTERFLNSHDKKDSQAREQDAPVALRAQEMTGTPANACLAASTHILGWYADPPEHTPGGLMHTCTPDHSRSTLAHAHASTESEHPHTCSLIHTPRTSI